MTDKPFGVNLTFLPAVTPPDYPGFIKTIIDSGVKAVETAGNNPQKYMPALKEARDQGDPQMHRRPPRPERPRASAATRCRWTGSNAAAIPARTTWATGFSCPVRRKS